MLEGILCPQVQHSQCWCELLLSPSRDVSLVGALSTVRGPEPEEAPEATPGRRSCWQIPMASAGSRVVLELLSEGVAVCPCERELHRQRGCAAVLVSVSTICSG